MNCDLCGKEAEMYRAIIEGSEVTVCGGCAKYGKPTGSVRAYSEGKKKGKPAAKYEEIPEVVASNFGELLKRKREELGLNQKEFARMIAEKDSILHKLETGGIMPTLEKARALERMFGLKLVEELKDEMIEQKRDSYVMTLGDMIKIKAKKGK